VNQLSLTALVLCVYCANVQIAEDVTVRKTGGGKTAGSEIPSRPGQEEERARIARDLHDDVNQRLAMLAVQLNQLKRSSLNLKSSHVQKIDALWKLTSEISTDVRKVSHHLHPGVLDLLGLVAALSEFCNEFARMNEMKIEFVHREVPTTLSKETMLCLYRVAQEAIRNAQKHSGCCEVRVELIGTSECIQLEPRSASSCAYPILERVLTRRPCRSTGWGW